MRIGTRAVLALAIALSTALALAVAGLLALAFSNTGLHLAYDLARPYVPGELAADALEGTLAGPLRIRELKYRDDTLALRIASAEFNWRVARGILVLALEADTVEIRMTDQTAKPRQQRIALEELSLPFPVRLARIALRDIKIDDSTPAITIEGAAAMAKSRLQIKALTVAAGDHRVQATGWLETRGKYPLDLQINETIGLPRGQAVNGETHLTGSVAQLQVAQRLAGAVRGHVEGEITDILGEPRWRAKGTLEPTPLAPLDPRLDLVLSGEFTGDGSLEAFSASASYRVSGVKLRDGERGDSELGDIEGALEASLAERALSIERLDLRHRDTATSVSASGSFNLDTQALALTAEWTGERIPRAGAAAPLPLATEGKLSGSGTLDAFAFDGRGKLTVAGYPQTHISLVGSGTRTGVSIAKLRLAAGSSRAEASGKFAWAPQVRGEIGVNVTDFDPSLVLPDWPGKLSGKAQLSGRVAKDGPTASISLPKLGGQLRGFPLSAHGTASIAGDNIEIGDFTLSSGASRVTATGGVADRWNLRFAVHSDNLAELLPTAGGRLAGKGDVRGPRKHPLAAIDLDAAQLHYLDYRADSLKLAATLNTAAAGNVEMTATASGFAIAEQRWRSLAVGVDGKMEQHRLTASAASDSLSVEAMAQGSLNQDYLWTGTLTQALFSERALGKWRLRAPAPLLVGNARADVRALCLERTAAQKAASLCIEGSLQDGDWQGAVIATALPFKLFEPFWPEKLSMSGSLSGRAALNGSAKGIASGSGQLDTTAGTLSLGTEATTVNYAPSSAKFALDERGFDAAIDWRFVEAGIIQGNIRLPGWRGEDGYRTQQPVDGKLHLNTTALPLMNVVNTDIANIEGSISSDMQIAGTLGAPQLSGQAVLKDSSAELPALGIKLSNIQLALAATPNREIGIQGSLRSGEGELRIAGGVRADPAAGWPLHLTLSGNNLQIVDIPEATAIASPQLRVKRSGNRFDLSGDIEIPKARLTPRELPEGVAKVSRDVTIVGRDDAAAQAESALEVHSQVRVVLGDEVHFDGLGLRGRFDGELVVVDTPGKPTGGRGAVNIHDGVYQAYGQNLHISQGRLLFAGPVDDPGLDVRAVRTIGTVTAGINATGTVRNPQLKLFSTPAMSDSDTLAYLLLGRPLNQASTSDGSMLMAAASSVGLGKGEEIAQSIGRSLGLDEVRIDSSGDTGGAGLVVGRYLSPKLYVRYLAGLFGAAGVLQLRYQLLRNIELQTESGNRAGADLFYSIER